MGMIESLKPVWVDPKDHSKGVKASKMIRSRDPDREEERKAKALTDAEDEIRSQAEEDNMQPIVEELTEPVIVDIGGKRT